MRHTDTKKKLLLFYLKFKSNWASTFYPAAQLSEVNSKEKKIKCLLSPYLGHGTLLSPFFTGIPCPPAPQYRQESYLALTPVILKL